MRTGQVCPKFERAAALLGKKWTGLILRVLIEGSCRFAALCDQVPDLSDRLLSERLQELEAEGVVQRIVHDSRPVRVEYRLTEKGRALAPVVEAIERWSQRWVEVETDPPGRGDLPQMAARHDRDS